MKKKITTFILAAMGAMTLTGCLEEVSPQGYSNTLATVTDEQASSAPGAFDNFVSNLTSNLSGKRLYNASSTNNVWDFGYTAFFLTRDVEGQDVIPTGSNNHFSTWYQNVNYLSPGYARTQFPWTLYYGWIKDCNTVIQMAGASNYGDPIEGREVGAGLAYAMRAMYYLDLCRMYAAKPYVADTAALTTIKVDENRSIEEAVNSERMKWNEAFAFILKDLDRAETLLADYKPTDVYTPSLNMVYGMKARTYLEMRDWANAEKYAKQAQSGYTMMSEAEYLSRDNGFNSPNSSWIFATQFKSTDPSIVDNDGDCSWGSVMLLENGFECGYAANYGGVNVIDRHLFNTIPATDFRRKCWIDFSIDSEDKATAVASLASYTAYPERVYESGKGNGYGLGGLSLKFRNAAGKADVKYDAWCVSIPLMRVEEMKLIEIEAAGMQDEARGKALLETFAKTRDAAFVYGNHHEAYYNTSTSAFQNEVWWQRRVELWGEGFATFDIKRLNKGIIRSYAGTNHVEGARWNVQGVPSWMVWNFVGTESNYNSGMTINPMPVKPSEDSEPFNWN